MGVFKPENTRAFQPVQDKEVKPLGAMDKFLGTVRSGLSGVTLGFADEIGTGIAAGGQYLGSDESYMDIYNDMMGAYKVEQDRFEKENPGVALTAEIAGGLATGGLGAVKTAALQGGARVAALGGLGAGYGAVSGAGHAEQGERLEGSIKGGTIGAGIGAAIPVVGGIIGEVFKKMLSKQPASLADKKIIQKIIDDGETPQSLKDKLRSWGEGATIVDVGGESMVNLSRASRDAAGKSAQQTKEFLEGRVAGEFDRLTKSFKSLLGTNGEFFRTVDDLKESRKLISKKVYERAFRFHIQVTPRMEQLLQRPVMLKAMRSAIRRGKDRGITLDDKIIDTRKIDYVKKELDNMIYKPNVGPEDRSVLLQLKHDLLREVDPQNPLYKEARNIWSGSKELEDAAEMGAKFMKGDQSVMARSFDKLSDAEQEFFRIGAVRGFKQYIGGTAYGNTIAQKLNNPNMQERLKAILPEGQFDKFTNALSKERRYSEVKNKILSGSQTQNKQAGTADLSQAGDILINVAQGNTGSTARGLGQAMLRFGSRPRPEVADQITEKITTNQNMVQNMRYLDSLSTPAEIHPAYRKLVDAMSASGAIVGAR